MNENKTKPTKASVAVFLAGLDEQRREEAQILIGMMHEISGEPAVLWGPSIIGFGTQHYSYDTGREGDMPRLGFSPRKAAITVYFNEGFDRYAALLATLGKHKTSVSCLYINKLSDINIDVLRHMLEHSYRLEQNPLDKPTTAEEYIAHVPAAARTQFDQLRALVKRELPNANEVLSYGIVGYKIDDKRARVFISGWKDHVAMYPIPKDDNLRQELKPYTKGAGTLWFALDQPLPKALITKTIKALIR